MKRLPLFFFLLPVACSFNYKDTPEQVTVQPDMIFSDITLKRYNHGLPDLTVYAQKLEMYDEEKIWAGQTVSFIQYDEKTQKEAMKGETGLLYIDEKAAEYSLGEHVFFHLIEDDFSVRSAALIWKKKEHMLAAPADETVTINQKDEVIIEGKNFVAHTATKEFSFNHESTGSILITEKQKKDDSL